MIFSLVHSKRIAYLAIPVFFVFLAYTSIPEALVGGQQKPDELVKQGIELYNSGQYEDAIVILKEASGLTKDRRLLSDAFFCLSLCYFQLNRLEETKEFILKTIDVDPTKKIDEKRYAPQYSALFLDLSKPKPKPEAGHIQVKSKPDGAQIFLDGTDTDIKTNSTLKDISVGDHTIALVKEGYTKYEQKVSVKQGKTQTLNIKLKATETGTQVATTQGRQPRPGGGVKWGRIALIGVVVIAAAAAVYFFVLAPKTGSIQVNSNVAGAQIFLDGTDTGKKTNALLEDISPGDHTVKLVKDGYADSEQRVSVKKGETATVNIDLSPMLITVTAPEPGALWPKGETVEIKWTITTGTSSKSFQGASRLTNMKDASSYFRRLSIYQARASFMREGGRRGTEAESTRSMSVAASGQRVTGLGRENRNLSSSLGENGWSGPKASLGLQDIRAQGLYLNAQTSQASPSSKQNPLFAKTAKKNFNLDIAQVKIDLYKGGALRETIAAATDNDGNHSWDVPTTLADGTDYKVRVSCSTDANVYGESGLFSIKEASIEITMPTSNTFWGKGGKGTINWTSTVSDNVKIDLLKGASTVRTIEESTQNDGSYIWEGIPAELEDGMDYLIRIISVTDSSIKGDSPPFIITKVTYQPDIVSTGFTAPQAITIDSSGYAHVSEASNIARFYPTNGAPYQSEYGFFGTNDNQTNQPKGVIFDSVGGFIYVADSGNDRILKLDRYGNFNDKTAPGELDNPFDVALDAEGKVYVIDKINNRVRKYSSSLDLEDTWSNIVDPLGIACDRSRAIVFIIAENGYKVYVYSLGGDLQDSWSINGRGLRIAVDKWGFVYITDIKNDRFLKYSPRGQLLCEKGRYGDGYAEFKTPTGICFDLNGLLLVTSNEDGKVKRFK